MTLSRKMLVACTNASGESDLFVCHVDATEAEIEDGDDYHKAEALAEAEGYVWPFVIYNEHEQRHIYRRILTIGQDTNNPALIAVPQSLNELSALLVETLPMGHVAVFDGFYVWVEGDADGNISVIGLAEGETLSAVVLWEPFDAEFGQPIIDSIAAWLKDPKTIPFHEMSLSSSKA
jgi:hypothetical protein